MTKLSDSILAPGWEWSSIRKVRKGRGYIRIDGSNFKYVNATRSRGDYTIINRGGCPYLKLAALTYCEEELKRFARAKERGVHGQ